MKVCVVGSGAREHALALAFGRSDEVVVTPGNVGIAGSTPQPPEEIDADLFVIGPEVPLVEGMADRLRGRGKLVFGPGADGAWLERSKAWMKALLADAGVPTARFGRFDEPAPAIEFLRTLPPPYVVKTDGLAAGKGVLVTLDRAEAEDDVAAKLAGQSFGAAGRTVVIEEGMSGPELSILAVCDGSRGVPLAPAQDHKRVFDGERGPNTGGMGAFSPVPNTEGVVDEVMAKAIEPTIAALRARGVDYRGVLYAGLMLTTEGPKIVEYNVRFGDPETQVVLPRFTGDLAGLLAEAASGRLRSEPTFGDDAAVCVVLAAPGYPTSVETGGLITGIEDAVGQDGVTVLHAGTARNEDGQLVTAGGRVLNVVGVGPTLGQARDRAYAGAAAIRFDGIHYRKDIASV